MGSENPFYRPTKTFNEFKMLETIHEESDLTQRRLCQIVGLSVSTTNGYLDDLESRGLMKREYQSPKTVSYSLTKKGVEHKNYLKLTYFRSLRSMYLSSRRNVLSALKETITELPCRLILYGSGEVAELILQVIKDETDFSITVAAVIDDEKDKQGQTLFGVPVIGYESIHDHGHDGILIASHTHRHDMIKNLQERNYSSKVYNLFAD